MTIINTVFAFIILTGVLWVGVCLYAVWVFVIKEYIGK
jgi:hypothetical protein